MATYKVYDNQDGIANKDIRGGKDRCGSYSRVQDIQSACDANPECKGFTLRGGGVKKPWCMKTTAAFGAYGAPRADHAFFQKQ